MAVQTLCVHLLNFLNRRLRQHHLRVGNYFIGGNLRNGQCGKLLNVLRRTDYLDVVVRLSRPSKSFST